MSPTLPGGIVAEKYRLDCEIGSGGMGVVYSALHIGLDQRVAIKLLHEYAMYDEESIARFMREARAAAKIASDHIARVIDVGSLPEGGAYIAMELLEGRDLADVLVRDGPVGVRAAVDYVIEACDAVAAAHAVGIIHRDLKPANLFIAHRPDGSEMVKVLDFGVSKILPAPGVNGQSTGLTQSGQIFGSPHYMSPEQLRNSADVDARTDIWALGIVLYELASGQLPYNAPTVADAFAAVVRDSPRPLVEVCPEASPELVAVIERCLEKDPERRYSTVVDLAVALLPFASPDCDVVVQRMRRLTPRIVASRMDTPESASPMSTPSHRRAARRARNPGAAAIDPSANEPITPNIRMQDGIGDKPRTPKMLRSTPNDKAVVDAITGASSSVTSSTSRKSQWIVGSVVLVAAILGIAIAAIFRQEASGHAHAAPLLSTIPISSAHVADNPSAAPVVISMSSASVKPALAKVRLEISTTPENVLIYQDKTFLGKTPIELNFDRSDHALLFRFVAPGYVTREVSIVPNQDRVLSVELPSAGKTPKGRGTHDLEPF